MGSGSSAHQGDEGRVANRLIGSTSPYLLQHAYNPVEWYPWGEEAMAKARAEGKPIFLSIGYSACHWCHVMEREVFEKPAIAAVMNANFVNIKVDREERPDLDELYMLATQLMSGSGGWPMSVWLTPELKPFYAGTYFPPEDAYGRPGFVRLEKAIADSWANRRAELLEQAERVVGAIRTHADETDQSAGGGGEGGQAHVDMRGWLATSLEQFADRFDERFGGLGSSPKFPPSQALGLWMEMLRHPNEAGLSGEEAGALESMVKKTLDGMMNGGIYDQVGGAFARYSTDERWLVPHFEKMLYDNAQLAPVYAQAAAHFGRGDYARVARQTLDFWLREMTGEKGGFYSTLDADSEGAEGKFYVWTQGDVRAALGEGEDAALMMEHLGITAEGNWEESPVEGASVLSVVKGIGELAAQRGGSGEELQGRVDRLLVKMREWRAKRVPPGLDDKVLTSWNGLMISAMAVCGRVLREPRYLEAAHRAMGFLLTQHMEGGRRLLRVSRAGNAKRETRNAKPEETGQGVARGSAHTDGFLEDHAFLLNGLMDLIDSTTPTSLPGTMARKRALELADVMLRHFEDTEKGGFFFTSKKHDSLFARMKNAADNATPSANGVAIRALLRLAHESGREQYRESAMRAVRAFGVNIARRPDFFPTILWGLLEDAEAREQRLGLPRELERPVHLPGLVDVGHGASGSGILSLGKMGVVKAAPGGTFELGVELQVAAGYHVQSNKPVDKEAFSTVARLRGEAGLAKQTWRYPEATRGGEGPGAYSGYEGKVRFEATCVLGAGVGAGRYTMRVTVLAQPCSGTSCLPPEKVSGEFVLEVS